MPVLPLGYVEAKDIGKSLDDFETTDQFARYSQALPNLIVTDYLEFRHYVDSAEVARAVIGRVVKGRVQPRAEGETDLIALLTGFFAQEPPRIGRATPLVQRMAKLAHLLNENIESALIDDLRQKRDSRFTAQYDTVRRVLVADIEPHQFADMYAQTLTYGMFAARLEQPEGRFDRQKAIFSVPATNQLLRETFDDFAGPQADNRIVWLLDSLAQLLEYADLGAIVEEWDSFKRGEDWVVRFYEDFLKQYDPKERKRRGVYYTPQPVIRYIVRAVDEVLKRDFNLPDGLTDKSKHADGEHLVQILDPATGTGSFLFGVVSHVISQFDAAGRRGQLDDYIRQHLLPRLSGFELQMAPYTIAHIKLARQLKDEASYRFQSNERINIYLTNTLEDPEHGQRSIEYVPRSEMVREAEEARRVKRERKILVVLGNPPYSGHSANASDELKSDNGKVRKVKTFIGKLVQDYFWVDGQPLGERNPKWLQDDYVKFIRWAQWRIEKTGQGVLAFITNHGYLDNPTFRGMRQSLLKTFDEIYILDLHGNSKRKEQVPEAVQSLEGIGPQDKNVFDIQQGVAICLMVKHPNRTQDSETAIWHADFWGSRDIKYSRLDNTSLSQTKWRKLIPQSPSYFFEPLDQELRGDYDVMWSVKSILPIHSVNFRTHRDHFVIDIEKAALEDRLRTFLATEYSDMEVKERLSLKDTRDWSLTIARDQLKSKNGYMDDVIQCLYRPFDLRWVAYNQVLLEYPSLPVVGQMREPNLAFTTTRQTTTRGFEHILATNRVSELKCISHDRGGYTFPLYLYNASENEAPERAPRGRRANLSAEFIEACKVAWKLKWVANGTGDLTATFGPEDVFHYMYAVFHSPEYRRRYADFLKRDFLRLPLTTNRRLLRLLCRLGAKLTRLHLMDPSAVDTEVYKRVRYPIPGTPSAPPAKGILTPTGQSDMNLHGGGGGDMITRVAYKPPQAEGEKPPTAGRVWINEHQYFEGVRPEVWESRVGGYQPAEKWLKDRKGRKLGFDDQEHYKLICAILSQTADLMQDIDKAIDKHGGWPLK